MDPVQISYHGLDSSPALSALIEARAAQLARLSDRIRSLRVVIGPPHHHHRHGSEQRVRVELAIPGSDIVVDHAWIERGSDEDAYAAVRHAFDVARRQLMAVQERQHGRQSAREVK